MTNVLLQGIGPESDTPQNEALPGQVPNAAGGFVYAVDDWVRLDRFLLLGTDSGTYYTAPRPFTKDSLAAVERCIKTDPMRVVQVVTAIHNNGRAPKTDPALYVLAMLWQTKNIIVRSAISSGFSDFVRTGTMLLHFANFLRQCGNKIEGRATRRLFTNWYADERPRDLEFQVVKYPSRDTWAQRDILRQAHPVLRKTHLSKDGTWAGTEAHRSIFNWVTKGAVLAGHPNSGPIAAFERAKAGIPAESRPTMVRANKMFREQLPTDWLNDPLVWDALMDTDMPATALLRNLGVMAAKGYMVPGTAGAAKVLKRLGDYAWFARARVHPITILMAARTYAAGRGMKGHLSWKVDNQIVESLDNLFHQSFGNARPTNKRILVALDVSGSMGSAIGGMLLTAREAAAAIGMVTYKTEPRSMLVGFTANPIALNGRSNTYFSRMGTFRNSQNDPDRVIARLQITRDWNFKQVTDYTADLDFGGTDCAAPMMWALKHHLLVDAFVVLTDNETWAGSIHPSQALRRYREASKVDAKLVVVAMTATGYSIADPNDAGMLDVVGFDAAVPNLISTFIGGGQTTEAAD